MEDFLYAGSIRHSEKEDDSDYNYFYANRFIDQVMFMRYLGGCVGHTVHYCIDETIASEEMDVLEEMDDPMSIEEEEVDWGIKQLPLIEDDGEGEDIEEDSADDVEENGTNAVEGLDMEGGISEASEEGFDTYNDP
ncbi:hypothetical protein M422DRAFT_261783 [Sphaerobolus stellatus SS14]|uniref:Uncharacterized protein n=1 Tax=Sphaerobolus stellatus (strain SS14) TaxID=990650 RepID=A0A0C9VEJ1_SPHS4|nr:hypothetical protein M422DRAFT_261783 [Sphaerobolus stellatus SS14]